MRKSGCNKLKLRVRVRPRNGGTSLFQRFLKMGASTADCIWQRAESIPELLNRFNSTRLISRVIGCAVKGAGPQRGYTRPGTGSLHPVAIRAAVEATRLLKPLVQRVAKATW